MCHTLQQAELGVYIIYNRNVLSHSIHEWSLIYQAPQDKTQTIAFFQSFEITYDPKLSPENIRISHSIAFFSKKQKKPTIYNPKPTGTNSKHTLLKLKQRNPKILHQSIFHPSTWRFLSPALCFLMNSLTKAPPKKTKHLVLHTSNSWFFMLFPFFSFFLLGNFLGNHCCTWCLTKNLGSEAPHRRPPRTSTSSAASPRFARRSWRCANASNRLG